MKPMYALHTDANANVLAAGDFSYSHQLKEWLGRRDFRPGDVITFAECTVRGDEPDPLPAAIETPPAQPVALEMADEEKPF